MLQNKLQRYISIYLHHLQHIFWHSEPLSKLYMACFFKLWKDITNKCAFRQPTLRNQFRTANTECFHEIRTVWVSISTQPTPRGQHSLLSVHFLFTTTLAPVESMICKVWQKFSPANKYFAIRVSNVIVKYSTSKEQ